MKKQTFSCTECQHFYGIDGVGEMWISCSIHGDFKVKKTSCPDFKKKVTKLDLLREIRQLRNENEKLLHQNEKYEMEIRALNSKIKDWYNDSAIAKLYEKEQDKTEMLEKAYEECNAKWEKLFAENKKLKHQLAQIPPKIKEVWIE